MFNKEDIVNIINDVKEIMIYGIESSIWILKEGEIILKSIDIDKLIINK